ncbi:MAG: glucose 1-dehydrogenase [Steroidobacteraceae bacterium]|nr:glucose 1-dehydrogenase [Steroidobacteraceae bacterium]
MARVADKVALVTGGASVPGIGSATAKRLAEEGAVVYVTDLDGAGAEAAAASIRSAGGQAIAMAHDVTAEADWDRVMGAIMRDHGRIDILVNNAGIAVLRMIDALSTTDWMRQMEVNLTSVYYGVRRAVQEMRRVGRGGSIVNLSSVAGLVGVPGCSAYAASKGGIRLFTKTVALETARDKIRVNSVHPGMIRTNIQKDALADNAAQYDIINAAIPMGHMGEAVDVANCILFLASDEARYVTGAEFVVDGGLTAQ